MVVTMDTELKVWRKPLEKTREQPVFRIRILPERCTGCLFCIRFCPRQVFETSGIVNKKGIYLPQVRDSVLCIGCGFCEAICPETAVFLEAREEITVGDA